eukprot:TRINITY_DN773156_c0_g1_i1.p1 TRINITY_DN773156_c0_g1~~TRINITY_DN773156_c0_g1_i1.p1  ORF type:complete len:311 (+),score=105.33 TRINITY_DN773156_c0_g1_i1:28-933(+)
MKTIVFFTLILAVALANADFRGLAGKKDRGAGLTGKKLVYENTKIHFETDVNGIIDFSFHLISDADTIHKFAFNKMFECIQGEEDCVLTGKSMTLTGSFDADFGTTTIQTMDDKDYIDLVLTPKLNKKDLTIDNITFRFWFDDSDTKMENGLKYDVMVNGYQFTHAPTDANEAENLYLSIGYKYKKQVKNVEKTEDPAEKKEEGTEKDDIKLDEDFTLEAVKEIEVETVSSGEKVKKEMKMEFKKDDGNKGAPWIYINYPYTTAEKVNLVHDPSIYITDSGFTTVLSAVVALAIGLFAFVF